MKHTVSYSNLVKYDVFTPQTIKRADALAFKPGFTGWIYEIVDKSNNFVYVGKTTNLTNRIMMAMACKNNQKISKVIRRKGYKNFTVNVLDYGVGSKNLASKEKYWIAKKAINAAGIYNTNLG